MEQRTISCICKRESHHKTDKVTLLTRRSFDGIVETLVGVVGTAVLFLAGSTGREPNLISITNAFDFSCCYSIKRDINVELNIWLYFRDAFVK